MPLPPSLCLASGARMLAPVFPSPAWDGCPVPSQPAASLVQLHQAALAACWGQSGLCFTSAVSCFQDLPQASYLLHEALPDYHQLTRLLNSALSCGAIPAERDSPRVITAAQTASLKLSWTQTVHTVTAIIPIRLYPSSKKQVDTDLMEGDLVI